MGEEPGPAPWTCPACNTLLTGIALLASEDSCFNCGAKRAVPELGQKRGESEDVGTGKGIETETAAEPQKSRSRSRSRSRHDDKAGAEPEQDRGHDDGRTETDATPQKRSSRSRSRSRKGDS